MARRNRRSSRVQTADKTFVFDLNPGNDGAILAQDKYVDLGQIHSLVNRVSARQGYEYVVAIFFVGLLNPSAIYYKPFQHETSKIKSMAVWCDGILMVTGVFKNPY